MTLKISLIGGNGMLGYDVKKAAIAKGYEVFVFDLPDFDITNQHDIRHAVTTADIVINCAAYTAVDKAESEQDICRRVNASACGLLAEEVKTQNKYLLHISTDFVFGDSSDKLLAETDEPTPLSTYGRTKLEGENLIRESGCKHAIIRVQWTYGINGSNFISKIVELAHRLDCLKVVADQIGSPTHTADVARAMLCLIEKRTEGLFHFAADGYASRYDVARLILSELKISKPLVKCMTADFKTPAERPLNSRFDCSKIDAVIDFKRPEWDETLKIFLRKSFSNQR